MKTITITNTTITNMASVTTRIAIVMSITTNVMIRIAIVITITEMNMESQPSFITDANR